MTIKINNDLELQENVTTKISISSFLLSIPFFIASVYFYFNQQTYNQFYYAIFLLGIMFILTSIIFLFKNKDDIQIELKDKLIVKDSKNSIEVIDKDIPYETSRSIGNRGSMNMYYYYNIKFINGKDSILLKVGKDNFNKIKDYIEKNSDYKIISYVEKGVKKIFGNKVADRYHKFVNSSYLLIFAILVIITLFPLIFVRNNSAEMVCRNTCAQDNSNFGKVEYPTIGRYSFLNTPSCQCTYKPGTSTNFDQTYIKSIDPSTNILFGDVMLIALGVSSILTLSIYFIKKMMQKSSQ